MCTLGVGAVLACMSSGQAQQTSLLTGVSTASCDQLNQLIAMDEERAESTFPAWLDGFLGGYNLALSFEVGRTASINLNTAAFPDWRARYQWLISMCRQHPERPLYVHATNLFELLRKEQSR
jgi:hypothetical protein